MVLLDWPYCTQCPSCLNLTSLPYLQNRPCLLCDAAHLWSIKLPLAIVVFVSLALSLYTDFADKYGWPIPDSKAGHTMAYMIHGNMWAHTFLDLMRAHMFLDPM